MVRTKLRVPVAHRLQVPNTVREMVYWHLPQPSSLSKATSSHPSPRTPGPDTCLDRCSVVLASIRPFIYHPHPPCPLQLPVL